MVSEGGLSRSRRFEVATLDEGEAEAFIRQRYLGNRIRFGDVGEGGGRFAVTGADTAGVGADTLAATFAYDVAIDRFDHFAFVLVDRGRLQFSAFGVDVVVEAGESVMHSIGASPQVGCSPAELRTLRLPPARLVAAAEHTAGISPADLRFQGVTPVSAGLARHWRDFMTLAGTMLLGDHSPAEYPIVAEELASTAAVTALHT